jgi:archaellum component FlaF (FlaF/FlaG flagellin family)
MVALVSAIGILMYSGATGLFTSWSRTSEVVVPGTYLIGNSIAVNVRNAGSTVVSIEGIDIYKTDGTLLVSSNTSIILDPGKTVTISSQVPQGSVIPGDVVDIVVRLGDGSTIKYTMPVQ